MTPEEIGAAISPTTIALGALGLALVLAFIRLARGPFLPDRVVALEVIAMLAVGIILTYAIESDQRVFMDVAIVMALITFLGTIAFARYMEKGERRDD
jgi:multicomponent Na+:H+ antiporter subunit F